MCQRVVQSGVLECRPLGRWWGRPVRAAAAAAACAGHTTSCIHLGQPPPMHVEARSRASALRDKWNTNPWTRVGSRISLGMRTARALPQRVGKLTSGNLGDWAAIAPQQTFV